MPNSLLGWVMGSALFVALMYGFVLLWAEAIQDIKEEWSRDKRGDS